MPIANTQELFLHELAELYDAEHMIDFGLQAMNQGAYISWWKRPEASVFSLSIHQVAAKRCSRKPSMHEKSRSC